MVAASLHDLKEIAVQKRQNHLGLGISETAVELQHLDARRRQHQTRIQHSAEGSALLLQTIHATLQHLLRSLTTEVGGQTWSRGVGTHASGVRTHIVVTDAFVVLRRRHRDNRLSVREA